ncbi:MAG: hypothetical protein HXY40_06085 [Chloroflexi bacterium]|nr:hypothetical protein [Chloroflexota bacterium]
MAPQKNNGYVYAEYSTSPWTEPYQQAAEAVAAPQDEQPLPRFYDSETLSPTHDALADIYNPED